MSIYQIRYLVNGLRAGKLEDNQKIWINENTLFQRTGNELSFLILTDDKAFEKNLQDISRSGLNFIKIYLLLLNCGGSIIYSGATELRSKEDAGKTLSVVGSFILRTLPYATPNAVNKLNEIFNTVNSSLYKNKLLDIALYYWTLAKEDEYNKGRREAIQFIHGMISLESLLGDMTELRYKISLRLALLLGLIGYNSAEVFKRAKQFYDKRSNVLHGGTIMTENSEINSEDTLTILKYSRDCILCFIILTNLYQAEGNKTNRQGLLDKLDECLLDVAKRNELEKTLKKDPLFHLINESTVRVKLDNTWPEHS